MALMNGVENVVKSLYIDEKFARLEMCETRGERRTGKRKRLLRR